MNIKSAKYITDSSPDGKTENSGIKAVIDDVEVSVPLSPDNRHYAAILEWAEEDGNEIQAAE